MHLVRSPIFRRIALAIALAICASLCSTAAFAQSYTGTVNVQEDFTGSTTQNPWYYFNGACLTASDLPGTGPTANGPGTPPGCVADHYYNENLVGGYNGVPGPAQTLPDPQGYGALRFTNGCLGGDCSEGGRFQNGAIVSANTFSTNQGLSITFKTITYRGDSGGSDNDGADGMSFFLLNAAEWSPTQDSIGSFGGSLGYDCSDEYSNTPNNGIVGAYLGLGIDEYGNFLNQSDNTASGYGYQPNRIGMRGAGNIAYPWLSANYPQYYPSSIPSAQWPSIVRYTCQTGELWNYTSGSPQWTGQTVQDYSRIPSAYAIVSDKIAREYSQGGYSRLDASPITYRVRLTANGLLSFWYSYNGGAWTGVLRDQSITAGNGPLPAELRFGFAGSTGGSSNIHELECFKATPITQASSSVSINQQQSSKLQVGAQVYFSYYDPSNWTGDITANSLDTTSNGVLSINPVANWDASCVLTGVLLGYTCPTTGQTGPIAAQGPSQRVMLTWNGSQGIPFEWGNLTLAQQGYLSAGDTDTVGEDRLEYLRGDRSNEIDQYGIGLFRDRDSVLSDIVDSSPVWVGPPSISPYISYEYPSVWKDRLYPSAVMAENSGQTYAQYVAAEATRLNVVYVGANDGFLHGFSAGSYNSSGTTYDNSTNTGTEVLAYMPQAVLQDIHNSSTAYADYSNPQYGHEFYVDAPPGTGDLYYKNAWHTWLVGGLGPGGADIYALDITNPANFSEANASNIVVGDWTNSTISCVNVSSCGANLGDTYGTPVIRLLHNGDWGIIFGNGFGSATGDAGIFIITVNPITEAMSTYYFSTGQSGTNDGIAYVSPVDIDGDHIVDYVYAGDLNGNVWRLDLTGNEPSSWGFDTSPIFKTPADQPITSQIAPAFIVNPSTGETQLMLYFGTGQKFPITESSPTTYESGTQSFYGVWDWNMSNWNSLGSTTLAAASPSLSTLTQSNLVQQSVSTSAGSSYNYINTTNPICWYGSTACPSGNDDFGWYINLPGTQTGYSITTNEQVIYNPQIVSTAVVFNSILPRINSPLSCTAGEDEGWTYAVNTATGGAIPGFFLNNGNNQTVAYETDASGTDSLVSTYDESNGSTLHYLIYQTLNGGAGVPLAVNPASDFTASQISWHEIR